MATSASVPVLVVTDVAARLVRRGLLAPADPARGGWPRAPLLVLRRYLVYSGYDVFHIMNLTDVDDRTIKAAAAAGKRLDEHTAPFVQAFFEDRDYLRIQPAHAYPRATASVPAMVRLVERLLERGVAYKGEDGSIYFAIAKFATYGRLSRLDTRELKLGARVASDEYAKDDPRDFALWKKAEPADERVGAAW